MSAERSSKFSRRNVQKHLRFKCKRNIATNIRFHRRMPWEHFQSLLQFFTLLSSGKLRFNLTTYFHQTSCFFSYDINVLAGIAGVLLWVSIISLSRIYFGMHSVLDLVLGIVVSAVLLAVFLPITEVIETFCVTNVMSPLLTLTVPIILIACFPTAAVRTPTK